MVSESFSAGNVYDIRASLIRGADVFAVTRFKLVTNTYLC